MMEVMAERNGKKMVSPDFSKSVYAGVGAAAAGAGIFAGLSSDAEDVNEVHVDGDEADVNVADGNVSEIEDDLDADASDVVGNDTGNMVDDDMEEVEVEVESLEIPEHEFTVDEAIDDTDGTDPSLSDSFFDGDGADSLEYDVQVDSLYNEDGAIM